MDTNSLLQDHLLKGWTGGKIKTYADGGEASNDKESSDEEKEKRLVQLRAKALEGTITKAEDKERLILQTELDELGPVEQPPTDLKNPDDEEGQVVKKYQSGGLVNRLWTARNNEDENAGYGRYGGLDLEAPGQEMFDVPTVPPPHPSIPTEVRNVLETPTPEELNTMFRNQLLSEFLPKKELEALRSMNARQRSPVNVFGQAGATLADALVARSGGQPKALSSILERQGKERENLGQRFVQGRQAALGLMSAEAQAKLAEAQATTAENEKRRTQILQFQRDLDTTSEGFRRGEDYKSWKDAEKDYNEALTGRGLFGGISRMAALRKWFDKNSVANPGGNFSEYELKAQIKEIVESRRQDALKAFESSFSGYPEEMKDVQRRILFGPVEQKQYPLEQKQYPQDVLDYAKQQNITPARAAEIKAERGGR